MSANFTVRLPKRLLEKMRKHREVNWSEVVRRSIEEYLKKLEELSDTEDAKTLLARLEKLGVRREDLEPLPPDEEERLYREMVRREWRRVDYSTRVQ